MQAEHSPRSIFKLRSYWTEVHQIYIQCSQIIIDELLKIRMAILQSISNKGE